MHARVAASAMAVGRHGPDRRFALRRRGRRIRPAILAVALPALAVWLGGCAAKEKTTGITPPPPAGTPCAGGASVQLASLQGAQVDCSAGTTVTLQGGGASYLIVPNLAVSDVQDQATTYTIGATGVSAAASQVPVTGALGSLTPGGFVNIGGGLPVSGMPGLRQRGFEAKLRRLETQAVSTGQWRATSPAISPAASPPPPLGSYRSFHVIASADSALFKTVTAKLDYVGTNILLYEDTAAPAGGFTSSQLTTFGQTYDQVLYPIDVNAFGPPSDIDGNGRLIMLLTPVVNALTQASQCQSAGYIAGFVTGHDLASTDSTSNRGEIFYAIVPDPNGTVSCAHKVSDVGYVLGPTFLHEVQHLINFSQHVLVQGGRPEDGWLDEGLSLMAEELGARYYENKYPPPSGRTSPDQIFPDSAEPYISNLLYTSYQYLLEPDTTALALHSDSDMGLAWRAGDWLLLHWLGDQNGGASFYRALEETSLTGTANIEAAAGKPFTTLFGDFSTALYTDSLPGVPRDQIPAQDRFSTRNLRQLFARLYTLLGPSSSVPYPYPVQPRSLPATGTISASLAPGAMAFYRVDSASSDSTVVITFSAPGGAPLAAGLHPQLSIFRLPPGS